MNSLVVYLYSYTRTWQAGQWVVNTPVARLLTHVEEKAAAKGLTLSRWQSSKAKWIVKITYAIHYGARPAQFRYLNPHGLVAHVVLHNREGKTRRCEAYRGLAHLLTQLEEYDVDHLS